MTSSRIAPRRRESGLTRGSGAPTEARDIGRSRRAAAMPRRRPVALREVVRATPAGEPLNDPTG
jgi:hypothetical protein